MLRIVSRSQTSARRLLTRRYSSANVRPFGSVSHFSAEDTSREDTGREQRAVLSQCGAISNNNDFRRLAYRAMRKTIPVLAKNPLGNTEYPNLNAWPPTNVLGKSIFSNGIYRNTHWRPFQHAIQQQQCVFFSTNVDDDASRKVPSLKLGTTKIPTPPSPPNVETNPLAQLRKETPKSILRKGLDFTVSVFRTIVVFLFKLPGNAFYYLTHSEERSQKIAEFKKVAQDELHHYWVGTKLLWADIQTARQLLGKTLKGSSLTRRERKQLLRTVSDLFRLVPFSMFVIIPFMEFALPLALKIFPNLLPSTFQDSLKAEESMKRELQSRIAMAQFFQETLEELAKEQKRKAAKRKQELQEAGVDTSDDKTIDNQEGSAASMLEFLQKARSGDMLPPDIIIRYANYFQDDLTLDNMPRMQLVNMCRYMGIAPYGSDSFLRFQLRHRIRVLKEDDQRILWEGIDSLTKMELREACQERGMRSTGLSKEAYKRALQQWLDLSVNKNVPISLLIMSRTFFLKEETFSNISESSSSSLAGLADTISGLDKEVLNEVILNVATSQEKQSDPEIRKLQLEVLAKQNELIRQEQKEREAAVKKKEESEKEKAESEAKVSTSTDTDKATESSAQEVTGQPAVSPDPIVSAKRPTDQAGSDDKQEENEPNEEYDLSTEEMEAISQLASSDPLSRERAELQRIKAAMKGGGDEKGSVDNVDKAMESHPTGEAPFTVPGKDSFEDSDRQFIEDTEKTKEQVERVSNENTKTDAITTNDEKRFDRPSGEEEHEEIEDPIVARLKKRLESMVDKIEVQLSDAQMKIGDKLHFLDKDKDGILSREELAEVLQQVLKRKISFEEALEIANEMDENKDGVFTVEELVKWCDENKLIRYIQEGRDVDRIFENQNPSGEQSDSATSQEKKESS